MDEQKRLILAIVLSMIVLFGYQMVFVKPPEPGESQPSQESVKEQTQSSQSSQLLTDDKSAVSAAPSVPVPDTPQRVDYQTVRVSTPLYNIGISEKGAAIKSFELKNYKKDNIPESQLKELISEKIGQGVLSFDLENQSITGLKDAIYTAKIDVTENSVEQGTKSIEFVWTTVQGYVVKKIFTFSADSYVIDCDVVVENRTATVLNDSIVFTIPGYFDDEIKARSRFAFEGPLLFVGDKYVQVRPDKIEITEKDRKKESKVQEKIDASRFSGQIEWAGFSERYFMTAVMPKEENYTGERRVHLSYVDDWVTTEYIQKMGKLDGGTQGSYSFSFYLGPKSQKVLQDYGHNLKEAVNFGGWYQILDIIGKPLLMIMNGIYSVIPNYGIAIILLTIFVKLVFWPLGTKSYKSMNKMKKVQPLMVEIREKYKDDKQRMNQEVMNLYKTYKVNPASGCLPILVQMPIFIALYRMLYQVIELRHAPFFGWITDLSAPDRLFEFPFAVPFLNDPDGIPLLTLIMGASFLLQQKMAPQGGDPMQQKMMLMMPIIMVVFFINFPSGLVLYMLVNNLLSMGQQYYTQKKFA